MNSNETTMPQAMRADAASVQSQLLMQACLRWLTEEAYREHRRLSGAMSLVLFLMGLLIWT